MKHKRKRKFGAKKRAPLLGRLARRKLGVEQLCDECSRPYLARPVANPVAWFPSGSVEASVFLEHRLGRSNFYVKLRRTATDGRDIILSDIFHVEHLDDVAKAADMALEFIRKQRSLRLVSRG